MAHFKVSSQKQYPPGFITFSLSFEGGSYRGCAKVTKRLFFFHFFLACGSIALKHVLIALWIALLMSLLACKQLVQRKYVCLPFVIAVPGTGPSSQWSPGMCVQKHLSYISFQQSPSPLFEVSACTRGRHLPGWFSLSPRVGWGQSSWRLSDPRLELRVEVGMGSLFLSAIRVCHYLLLQNFPFLQFISYKDWLIFMSQQALNTHVVAKVPPLWCCEMAGVGLQALRGSRIPPWVRDTASQGSFLLPAAGDVRCSASSSGHHHGAKPTFLRLASLPVRLQDPWSPSPHQADHFSLGAASLSLPLTSSTSNSWSLRGFTKGDIPLSWHVSRGSVLSISFSASY